MIKHVGSIDDISSGLQAMNRVYGHYNPVMIFEGYIPGMIYSNNENTDIELTPIPILRLPDFTPAELVVMAKAEIRRCCKSTIVFSTDIDHCAWLTFCLEGPTRSNRSQEVPNLDTIRAKVSNALCRQQIRIRSERRKALKIKQAAWINPNMITKTDLLGSRAPLSVASSPAWRMLEQMVGQGMQDVRDTLLSLIENENQNNARALRYEKPLIISRDRIFMGPPGSGKTTAALLYGQVLSELGFFPNRIVKLVSATSLISKHEDGTTSNTNQLLKETRDGVLILDDLHRIDLGEGQFLGAALLPTLLSSAQSSTIYGGPRGNGCILLVGDADSMEDLYQNAESGLRANYPLETAVKLRDFTSNELKQVLAINIQERKISLSEDAWNIALQTLEKARCRPAFGNGHAVRQLLDESLLRYYKRNAQAERGGDIVYLAGAVPEPPPLQPEDLDPSYNRLDNAHSNFSLLFHGLVDFEPIVTIFQDYAYTASGMKLRGIDPRAYIPFTFVFKGPPGTGKTSSARKLGQIFYDLGFLSSPDVVECSASNLVAKWVGHTGPLVIRQMEKALGRVLFIDEAYRLATTQGHKSFQDEAISELVDAITKPKFARKLVIVLAGYSEEMNALMSSNPGLRSRFATEIRFLPLSPKGCLEYLRKCVGKVGIQLDGLDPLPAPASLSQVEVTMMRLSASKNWASGRSIESIAERIMAKVFKRCAIENDATGPMIVTAEELSTLLDDILKENSGQRRAHTSQAGYHLGDTQYIL